MSSRVSAQSLALACMSAVVDLQPSLLPSLHPYLPFTTAHDPKLKSRVVKVSQGRRKGNGLLRRRMGGEDGRG